MTPIVAGDPKFDGGARSVLYHGCMDNVLEHIVKAELLRAVDVEGEETSDLSAVVDGEFCAHLDDGRTIVISFDRMLQCAPVRITA